MKTKNFKLVPFKMELEKNGDVKGFSLKRKLTYRECAHITRDILGIDIGLLMENYDDKEDRDESKEELIYNVTQLITGESRDADFLTELDCDNDEGIGIWNAFPIVEYLQKIKAI